MRGETELVFGNVLLSVLDAGFHLIRIFQLREFGSYEAKDNLLVFNFSQRCEGTGPVCVEFEEEAVHMAVAEEQFCNSIICAGGEVGGPEVTTANM